MNAKSEIVASDINSTVSWCNISPFFIDLSGRPIDRPGPGRGVTHKGGTCPVAHIHTIDIFTETTSFSLNTPPLCV